jgi:hypothetical protein
MGEEMQLPFEPESQGLPVTSTDQDLDLVFAYFEGRPNLERTFATAIRQALDEVIDGPRTGRFRFSELEKTEKTYIGTRVEIVVRSLLGLERQGKLDTFVADVPIDIKWSASEAWMIPTEAVGQICLLVGTRTQGGPIFDVGLQRCSANLLNLGSNKDQKTSLNAVGRAGIRWLVSKGELEPNYLSTLPEALVQKVLAERSGQARLRRLFSLLPPGTPVPRMAAATLGQQADPMRRLRSDQGDRLAALKIFSGAFTANREAVSYLGYGEMPKDTFVAVPRERLAELPDELRGRLKLAD